MANDKTGRIWVLDTTNTSLETGAVQIQSARLVSTADPVTQHTATIKDKATGRELAVLITSSQTRSDEWRPRLAVKADGIDFAITGGKVYLET